MTKTAKVSSVPAALPASTAVPDQSTGLAMVSDLDQLEQVEEEILESRLAGEESVAAYLYVILPDEQNRLPKAVVGPTADFVVQLCRRINQVSRGRVKLKLLPEPPVVTDFTVPDDRGRQIPFVRVIVGAIDEASGEVTYGIKETKRAGKDPTGVAHTRAIRRALELHPSYNRKLVGKFIREKLRELGYDPEKFVVQAGAGGGEWGKFFAMARAQGVDPKQLRAAVREKTGKGLSEVATAAEVDQAAQAAHQVLQEQALPVPSVQQTPNDLQNARQAVLDAAGRRGKTAAIVHGLARGKFRKAFEELTAPELRELIAELEKHAPVKVQPVAEASPPATSPPVQVESEDQKRARELTMARIYHAMDAVSMNGHEMRGFAKTSYGKYPEEMPVDLLALLAGRIEKLAGAKAEDASLPV